MHYMMILKGSADCEAGKMPSEGTRSAIRKYTQELRKAGALVELSRLHPSSRGVRVHRSAAKSSVLDGPFAETKELVGGYWVIEAQSMSEAIEWAKRVPLAHGDAAETVIEIRQYVELEDFVTGELQDRAASAAKS